MKPRGSLPGLAAVSALVSLTMAAEAETALQETRDPPAQAPMTARPKFSAQRWQEDWSALKDRSLWTSPLDALKYIGLAEDPQIYLSLGGNVRERVEGSSAPAFGTGHLKSNTYLLDRLQVHADLRLPDWEAFVQLEDARAPGKAMIGSADADRLDLEQAFVAHFTSFESGVLKLRAGRQEFGFDLQRFVSNRDGPNVRQAYDALWGDYESGLWRLISFVSRPVQYYDVIPFDDHSNGALALDGFRVERSELGPGSLALYYLHYERAGARFASTSGDEQRNAFDAHYSGMVGNIDFDAEAMIQQGTISGRPLLAWAFGERSGYTFSAMPWKPHLSLQIDAASGNHSTSGTFGTFNPLFPNGSYFTLSSLTGDANLIHVKPILGFTLDPTLTLQAAVGFQWRATTRDAIYTFPAQPIAGTAGQGSAWSGAYVQLDAAKQISANITLSTEYVHYVAGATIKAAGGRDSDYGNIQLSLAW